jgi:hypothetical protein
MFFPLFLACLKVFWVFVLSLYNFCHFLSLWIRGCVAGMAVALFHGSASEYFSLVKNEIHAWDDHKGSIYFMIMITNLFYHCMT